jgi:hypothetical protein
MKSVRFAVAAAAFLAVPAFAQPPASGATPPPPPAMPGFPLTRTTAQQMVQQRFAARDANHDGYMTNDELGGAAARIIGRLDSDHDGRVSQAEAEARTLADFDAADADHNGIVTEAESAATMSPPAPAATPPATPATPQPQGN